MSIGKFYRHPVDFYFMNKNNPIRKLCGLDTSICSKKLMVTNKLNHEDPNGQE